MPFYGTENDVEIYFEESGTGTTIVFVHGFAASRHVFKRQISELRATHRVVSFDLRGHGLSKPADGGFTLPRYAEDFSEILEYLNLDSVQCRRMGDGRQNGSGVPQSVRTRPGRERLLHRE